MKINDLVKVINPIFVTRVGYPNSFYDYTKLVWNKETQILNFITNTFPDYPTKSITNNIVRALAYELAKRDNFGGTEKTIHWNEIPELKDSLAKIVKIRTVKTGTYYPTGNMGNPKLSNTKSNKLVRIYLFNTSYTFLETTLDKLELYPEENIIIDFAITLSKCNTLNKEDLDFLYEKARQLDMVDKVDTILTMSSK